MTRRRPRPPGAPRWGLGCDRGSGSVWLLGVGLVLLAAGLAGAAVGGAHVARHQAQSAADLAALAGAARAIEGHHAACTRAAELVTANRARLTRCELAGLDLTVTVAVTTPLAARFGRPATATARAGPVRANDSRAGPAVTTGARAGPSAPRHNEPVRWALVQAPTGPVAVGVDKDVVRAVRLHPADAEVDAEIAAGGLLGDAVAQLTAYFAGERTRFDLPLSMPDDQGSEFERAVWAELTQIPYGEMRTYGEVAAAVGDGRAARAVGTACNRNPIPLLVPCHRVVGAGGKLVGFGGGLAMKRWLLEHEARVSMQRAWG